MNEEYISTQIAVYKNSKTLLEFHDKLKVASMYSYAHIHADGEDNGDGRRKHSLIGILMKDIPAAPEIKPLPLRQISLRRKRNSF